MNVSLGLPIDRTSVDHEVARTGRANHVEMLSALSCAARLARARRPADAR